MTQSQFGGYNAGSNPLYTYRDQSLSSLSRGDPIAVWKRQQFLRRRSLIKLSFIVLTVGWAALIAAHYVMVYASYQQGTCTITDKQVREYDTTSKSGDITDRRYVATFSYEVHLANGGQAVASDFDGPISRTNGTFTEAETIVDRYAIDQTVPCWYNPSEPSHAFLVFYEYQWLNAFDLFFSNVVGFGSFAVFVYLLFDWCVWRLYALARRGVLTWGGVRRYEQRSSRYGRYTVSIVGYYIAEDLANERFITISNVLPSGCAVPICYDPFCPRYRRSGSWPAANDYVPGVILIGMLLSIVLVVMLILWLIP